MLPLDVHADPDGCWADLGRIPEKVIDAVTKLSVSAAPSGERSKAPTVAVRMDLPDGRVAVAETSLRDFWRAAKLFAERYGEPR